MKTLFVTFLLFAFYGTSRVYGQEIPHGVATVPLVVATPMRVVPPQTILVPQVTLVPYQLQRIDATPWRTPIRSWLWGPMRMTPVYAPQVQQ